MSTRGYILVEGHGEVDAAGVLVRKIAHDLGHWEPWAQPRRWKNLHQQQNRHGGGLEAGVNFMRSLREPGALLILRDEDDACPRDLAPSVAEFLRTLNAPFPIAYVLLHREYEVLFLPCLDRMQRFGFPDGLQWDGETWESRRDIKGWLSQQLPPGRAYKPTTLQASMTAALDLPTLRSADVPSFGTLERAIQFLHTHWAQHGLVYP